MVCCARICPFGETSSIVGSIFCAVLLCLASEPLQGEVGEYWVCAGSHYIMGGNVPGATNSLAYERLVTSSEPTSQSADSIIEKMIERNRFRNTGARYSAVRTYGIRNFDGKLSAQEVVRVDYEAPDKKTFTKTSEKGSGIVRHVVSDRLIQSEGKASSGQEHHDSAISLANYMFKVAGEEEVGSYHCFVLEAIPKRNDKYLFEGRVWIDMADFAIVKIAGHPAKKLSFWINRADFVREYQRIDGFWVPARDETTVELKLHGHRRFTINHEQYVFDSVASVPANNESVRR